MILHLCVTGSPTCLVCKMKHKCTNISSMDNKRLMHLITLFTVDSTEPSRTLTDVSVDVINTRATVQTGFWCAIVYICQVKGSLAREQALKLSAICTP